MKIRIFLIPAVLLMLFACQDGGQEEKKSTTAASSDPYPVLSVKRNATPVYSGTGPYPFGNVLPGQSSNPVVFTVENKGSAALDVTAVSITGDSAADFTHNFSEGTTLASGASLEIEVIFTPTTSLEGSRYAQLNITHNDTSTDSPFMLKLSGYVTVKAPEIHIADQLSNSLLSGSGQKHFGTVVEGASSAAQSFTISNLGNEKLSITGISISDTSNFTLSSAAAAATLEAKGTAGSSTAFSIVFNPASSGYKTATVTVASNDSDEASYTFTVAGNASSSAAVTPEINVKAGSVTCLTGSTYSFGNVKETTSSGAKTFTVQNIGTAELTVTSVSCPGTELTVSATGLPATIAAGATYTFSATYSPVDRGADSGTVTIASNDTDESTYTINLSGTGTGAEITMSASPSDFGSVAANTSGSAKQFTIKNDGNADMNVSTVTLATGTNYVINSFPAGTIPAGGSSSFYVTFNPKSISTPMAITDTITIYTNDVDEPAFTIGITGVGTANPEITLLSEPTNFGYVSRLGGTNSQSYTIKNDGTTTLTITNIAMSGGNADCFSPSTTSFTVPVGSTRTFTVTFNPSAAGTPSAGSKSTTMNIVNDDVTENSYPITLNGVATEPQIQAVSAPTFLSTAIGSTNSQTITISNANLASFGEDLQITSVALAASAFPTSNPSQFSISSMPSGTITPGGSTTLTVTFKPDITTVLAGGTYTANLIISTNDPDGNTTVPLSAGYTINPVFTMLSAPTAFGTCNNQAPAETSSKIYTVKNSGSSNLQISGISLPSDFNDGGIGYPVTIVPGATHDFEITFTAGAILGARGGNIVFTNNDPSSPPSNTVAVTAFSVEQQISLTAVSTAVYSDNGNETVGSNEQRSFRITNTTGVTANTDSLTITNVQLVGTNPDQFTIDMYPATTINPGGTSDFLVSYRPNSSTLVDPTAPHSAIIHITSDDEDSPTTDLTITGTAARNPVLTLTTAPTTFGSAEETTSGNELTYTIKNTGTTDLILDRIFLSTTSNFAITSGGFAAVNNPPPAAGDDVTVTPNSTYSFKVQFQPSAGGSGTLSDIINFDTHVGSSTLTIYGDRIARNPEINVKLGATSIEDNNAVAVDFGSANWQTPVSIDKNFTIENYGDEDLSVTGFTSAGDFTIISPNPAGAPWTITPGLTLTFTVRFTPTVSAGIKTATIQIANSDSDEAVYDLKLSGTSTEHEIDVNVNGINRTDGQTYTILTNCNLGSSQIIPVNILNTGTDTLTIVADVTKSGADSAQFSIDNQPIKSIAGGSNAVFYVTYNPAATGSHTVTLTINHNDTDDSEDPYEISITGNCVGQPEISMIAAPTDFGSVNEYGATSVTRTYIIKNEGSDDLVIGDGVAGGNAPIELSTGTDFSITSGFITDDGSTETITPGNTYSFVVTFNPNTSGSLSDTISLQTNDSNENPYTIPISGIGVEAVPDILVNSTVTDFGSVNAASGSVVSTITITNTGTGDLVLGDGVVNSVYPIALSNATHFSVTSGSLADAAQPTIVPGGSYSCDVTFNPVDGGTHNSTLIIRSNDPDEGIYSLGLTGTGTAPEITIISAPVDFGSTNIGSPVEKTYYIQNEGSQQLQITSIGVSGDFSPSVASLNIDPGFTGSFTVTFTPTAAGARSTTLTLTSNDVSEPSLTFTLTGTANADAPNISVSGTTSFGTRDEDTGSRTETITVTNNGTADLVVSSIALSDSGNYTLSNYKVGVTTTPLPWTIPAGQSGYVDVTFDPNNVIGNVNSVMTIVSNDPDTTNFAFVLAGISQASEISETTVSTDFLTVTDIVLGVDDTKYQYTITNNGNAGLIISDITITPSSSAFTVTNPNPAYGTNIPNGSTCTFDVTFDPESLGTHNAVIKITSDAYNATSGNDYEIQVTGVAQSPVLTTSPANGSSYNFGNVVIGQTSAAIIVQINNSGTAPLNLTSITSPGGDFVINNTSSFPVAAGGSTYLSVTLTPSAAVVADQDLVINCGNAGISTITFEGAGIQPDIAVSPATFDFGDQQVGTSSTAETFTVGNTGAVSDAGSVLTVSNIFVDGTDSSMFTITQMPTLPLNLTKGSSDANLKVVFTPGSDGTDKTASLKFVSNDPDHPVLSIPLTGDARQPNLEDIANHNYANTVISGTTMWSVPLSNDGDNDTTLIVTGFSLSGMNSDQFTISAAPAVPLSLTGQAAANTDLLVDFKPTSAGTKTATLYIYSNDPDTPTKQVTITGTSLAQNITVSALTINPQLVGTQSIVYPVIINNTGDPLTTLTVSGSTASISGTNSSDFAFVTNPDSAISGSDSSNTMTIRFTPSATGTRSATLNIPSDDPDTPSYPFTLTGSSVSSMTIDDPDAEAIIRGEYSRIAVGASGAVYAVYYDQTDSNIIFAKSTDSGANWVIKDDVDPAGLLPLVASTDLGKFCDIFVNEPNIYISYYDDTNDVLKIAFSADSGDNWSIEVNSDLPNTNGQYSTIESDGTNLFVAYYDAVDTNLEIASVALANLAGSGALINDWSIRTDSILHNIGGNDVGTYISSYAGSDYLFFAHVDNTSRKIYVTRYDITPPAWDITDFSSSPDFTVDTASTNSFQHTSITGMGSYVYVTYFDADNGDLEMATSSDNGVNWTTQYVVQKPIVIGKYNSTIIDSYGDIHISYYDETNKRLRHAWYDGTWLISTVDDSTSDVGQYSSMGFFDDNVYIIYFDNAGDKDLKISKSVDGGASW